MSRRIGRILPALYVYLLFVFLFFDVPLLNVFLNAVFLSNYMTDALTVGPVAHLWSLCVEIHFYLFVAALVLLFGTKSLYILPALCIVVTIYRINLGVYYSINTHLRVDEILAGGSAALFAHHFGRSLKSPLIERRGVLLIIVCSLLFFASSHVVGADLNYFRPYFCSVLFYLIVVIFNGYFEKWLNFGFLR